MPDLIYDKTKILELIDAHKNISGVSFDEARNIENRSATFLWGYAHDQIGITTDATEVMPEYFDILSTSSNLMIKDTLEEAKEKFAAEIAPELQKDLNEHEIEIIQNELSPEEQRFEALKDKESLDITSEEYLFAISFLTKKLNDAKPNSDELRLAQRQFSYLCKMAQHKIDQVFEGEIPSDDEFPKMVRRLGTPEQKETLGIRTQELIDSGIVPTVAEPVSEDIKPATVTPLEPEINTPIAEEAPVIAEPLISEPKKQEKSSKKSSKKSSAAKPTTKGEPSLDSIVYNSKKLAALSAKELLEVAERIEALPNEKQKRRMKSTFRYFIVKKLDNPKKVNLSEAGLDVLADKFGTAKQRALFKPKKQEEPVVIITPKPVIEPKKDEIEQPHATTVVMSHVEPKPKMEKKKAKVVSMPWYKRFVAKVAIAATLFIGTITAIAGVAKNVFGSDGASNNDNATKTEAVAKTVKKAEQDNKTANFNQVRTAQEKAKQAIQARKAAQAEQTAQIKQDTQAKQNTMLTKEDAKCVKNTARFLKKIAQKHNISVEEAQQRLSDFVNSLDLPQGISSHRMAYLTSIHALFPNSEFGTTAKKVFDGESIQISKDDISKLDKEFSKPGRFGHKNNKYNTTFQVVTQAKSQVK